MLGGGSLNEIDPFGMVSRPAIQDPMPVWDLVALRDPA